MSVREPSGVAALLLLLALSSAGPAVRAQVHLSVDSASSLAWWQVQPHWDHLWATTCPQDTTWQPGGGAHSPRYHYRVDKDPLKGRLVDMKATMRTSIPVYQRPVAARGCTPALHGEIVVADTATWRGVRGLIVIQGDDLVTGLDFRDEFAHKHLLETFMYPDIRFVIDSLTDIQTGDTLEATAMGTLEIRGQKSSWGVPIHAWHEPLGLRVRGQFAFPVQNLISVYKMPSGPLWMGVGAKWWKFFHLGIDAILVPTKTT